MNKILKTVLLLSLCYTEGFSETPKDDVSWGVEINPFSLTMFASDGHTKAFSGAVSRFDQSRGEELALSLTYIKDYDYNSLFNQLEQAETAANLSLNYRKFLHQRTSGFYYGGFASYTYLDGEVDDGTGRLATVGKLGAGLELGVRLMKTTSNWSFYWGPSFRAGIHVGPNSDMMVGETYWTAVYDKKVFVDLDIFRIGFRF